MATRDIGRRLLVGGRPRTLCARCMAAAGWQRRPRFLTTTTATTTTTTTGRPPPPTPLRKQIKDETKARKRAAAEAQGQGQGQQAPDWQRAQAVPGWELTVGIEIHAQLNTARKLFSRAAAGAESTNNTDAAPNTRVALFDAALPGAQPLFQAAAVVPAVRAALALGCAVQPVSRFDRKHYFHWDQPAGYQITQYYEPLARGGRVVLRARDGIAAGEEEGDEVAVDIVQVQLEQDTAKTLVQPGGSASGDVHWLDLNRVGVALVEIISAPQIRHPATAAAFVRKVQQLLRAVDACTAGMEAGGLRADVNVSVRRTGDPVPGTRTEIKNLNSFRAVEDAVLAERNRQIAVLAAGGQVEGETRGWTPGTGSSAGGGGTTHRLRSKADAVDYRYMPDPDLPPLRIDPALPAHLAATLGVLPDAELDALVATHGLTTKDALALTQLDDGGRAQFYYDVVAAFEARLGPPAAPEDGTARRAFVANWVLHQLGRLTSERHAAAAGVAEDLQMTPAGRCRIPAAALAELLAYRHQGRITAGVAKELLFALFRGDIGGEEVKAGAEGTPQFATVADAIDAGGLWFREITAEAYADLARQALEGEAKTLRPFVEHAAAVAAGTGSGKAKKYPHGKLQYLTGKLMRLGPEGRTDPQAAEAAMRRAVEDYVRRGG